MMMMYGSSRLFVGHILQRGFKRRTLHMMSRLSDYEELRTKKTRVEGSNSQTEKISVKLKYGDDFICEKLSVDRDITVQDLIHSTMNKKMSKRLAAASVNGALRDLSETLTEPENHVELHDFESDVGIETLWHSASHVLGYALEKQFGDKIALCDGPALRLSEGGSGFFYELRILSKDLKVSPDDIPDLETHMKEFVRQNHAFERLRVSKDDALKMFESNRLKKEFIENIDESEDEITLYRCGDFVDLCRGPHVPRTGLIQAHKLLQVSGAHHDDENVRLSRVYVEAFESIAGPNTSSSLKHTDTVSRSRIENDFVLGENSRKMQRKEIIAELEQLKTSSCFTRHLPVMCFGYQMVCISIKNFSPFFETSIDRVDMMKCLHLSC